MMRHWSAAALAAALSLSPAIAQERAAPPPPVGADSEGMFYVTYPRQALAAGAAGSVHYETNIDRRGRPTDCVVTRGSGFAELDRVTCVAVVNHGRFVPVRNESGQAISGVYYGRVDWKLR